MSRESGVKQPNAFLKIQLIHPENPSNPKNSAPCSEIISKSPSEIFTGIKASPS